MTTIIPIWPIGLPLTQIIKEVKMGEREYSRPLPGPNKYGYFEQWFLWMRFCGGVVGERFPHVWTLGILFFVCNLPPPTANWWRWQLAGGGGAISPPFNSTFTCMVMMPRFCFASHRKRYFAKKLSDVQLFSATGIFLDRCDPSFIYKQKYFEGRSRHPPACTPKSRTM